MSIRSQWAANVPQCAMKVKIDKDGGQFSPYHAPVSCTCAFEAAKLVTSAAGTCTIHCTKDTDCNGRHPLPDRLLRVTHRRKCKMISLSFRQ